MNYIDKNIKEISNNNTIGILICKKENNYTEELDKLSTLFLNATKFNSEKYVLRSPSIFNDVNYRR